MTNVTVVTGMVLSSTPVGEYDKRVVLLTREEGLISAFARGARRPKSPLLAATTPMAFGTFDVFLGQSSNTIDKARITQYFENVRSDYDRLCLASYCLETASYYGQPAVDESERLMLLYQTFRAMGDARFSPALIRCVYDLKTLAINGEYPHVFSCVSCGEQKPLAAFHFGLRGCVCKECAEKNGGVPVSESVLYTLQYIYTTPAKRIYSFVLDGPTEQALVSLLSEYRRRFSEHRFRAEDFLV